MLVGKVWACRALRQGLPQDEASQVGRDHWLESLQGVPLPAFAVDDQEHSAANLPKGLELKGGYGG